MTKKIILISSLFAFLFLLTGCGKNIFDYSRVSRDEYNTGGNLTFIYDDVAHVATFGGRGEVVQYYDVDIAKGWLNAGNRVGVQILAPSGVKNFETGSAKIGDEIIKGDKFYKQINNENSKIAQFFPILTENNREIAIKITWEDNSEEQIYYVVAHKDTVFMKTNEDL